MDKIVDAEEPRLPLCLNCKIPMNAWTCADACAVAELRQCGAIVTCAMCGTKNQIYSVVHYRVLKIFEPATRATESEGGQDE